jgi:hypothetical protein
MAYFRRCRPRTAGRRDRRLRHESPPLLALGVADADAVAVVMLGATALVSTGQTPFDPG